MKFSPRQTRQQSKRNGAIRCTREVQVSPGPADLDDKDTISSQITNTTSETLEMIPIVDPNVTNLSKSELQNLKRKQDWLKTYTPSFPETPQNVKSHLNLPQCLASTLVFAQEEAGTAVCISSTGLILTCSHCISEQPDKWQLSRLNWLIFASGQAVQTECIAWDGVRDLALLKIIALGPQSSAQHSSRTSNFPYIPRSPNVPKVGQPLICIGHPGAEDLESVVSGTKTNYDVLYISQGRYRGYAPGQDIQDNSEIGALRHDCWTYCRSRSFTGAFLFQKQGSAIVRCQNDHPDLLTRNFSIGGHSGAPIINSKTGELVGLHSSWDETTGMRRGVGLEAIREFIRNQNLVS